MIALLLAAQLSAEVVRDMPADVVPARTVLVQPFSPTKGSPFRSPLTTERTPNAYKQPAHCKDATVKVVDRDGHAIPKKLSDLPPGALQYAVDRKIDGCRVITVVYGNVIPDDPDGAATGRLTPLIKAPAVRGDGLSNRR